MTAQGMVAQGLHAPSSTTRPSPRCSSCRDRGAAVLVERSCPAGPAADQVPLTVLGLLGAFGALVHYIVDNGRNDVTAGTAIAIDGPSMFLQGTILVLSLLAVLVMGDRGSTAEDPFTAQAATVPDSVEESRATAAGWTTTETYPLLLFSIGGMMLLPAANDLLTMFVALEVLSLPLYLLCGIARRRRRLSQEASLKYFLLGAFSSAFFLYGTALLYGYAGSVGLPEISGTILGITGIERTNLNEGMDFLLLPGAAMVLIGMLFKIGAAPFHVWTPDVYQGAPTPITGFMASVTKVAAFGALLRLAYIGMPGLRWDWQPVLFVVAIVTMLVGSIVAVVQADVKRMLAYSSIAHAGFLLIGILAMDVTGVRSTLFYLLVYGVTTVGAFALVSLVRTRTDDGGLGGEATRLSQWAGLGRRSPWLAGTFSLLLLALAGIPLTSGFIGKFGVFASAVDHFTTGVTHGGVIVVVFGVLASVIAAFFYVRVIVLMYFSDPIGDTTVVAVPGPLTAFAITVVAGVTILLGVYPSLLMDLTERLSLFQPS